VFGLVIGFTGLLKLVPISNYSRFTSLCTLQFTMAHYEFCLHYALPSTGSRSSVHSSASVFTMRCLVPDSATAYIPRLLFSLADDPLSSNPRRLLQVSLYLLNSSKLHIGSRYIASRRIPKRTPPPTVLLLLCYCDHVMVTDC
jgi:hypothetical protein